MASESSSAMLDMTDADSDDMDMPTLMDDQEPSPLIMEHGYDIAIKVDAPIKQLSTLETYVTYRVRCVCARWPTPPSVRRRYNHFKVLHKRLSAAHPLTAAPPAPPLHSARQQLDRYSASFVAIRTLALNAFLDRIAKHPILTHSEDFRLFLTTPDEEIDKVFRSENNALNLWGLGSALAYGGDGRHSNGVRVKDPEFSSAVDYLNALQDKLATLCDLTTKLYKGTAALAAEYSSMQRVCDVWSTQCGARCGGTQRGVRGLSAGAGAAGQAAGGRPSPSHRAVLPLLAAYAAAQADKIRQRDRMHAEYVSGTDTSDDLQNRVEEATEALRSELWSWTAKTHQDIKGVLAYIATRQVSVLAQSLQGWEQALRVATDTSVHHLFQTVSKNGVRNLSPTTSAAPHASPSASPQADPLRPDSPDGKDT